MNSKRLLSPAFGAVIVAALVLTYFTYPASGYVTLARLKWMAGPLSIIELPAVMFGIFVSGNEHQPDPVATYAALFLTYLFLVGVVSWLGIVSFRKIRNQ